ncbi:MAG: hypothetical protein IJI61_00600 [Oscillospiraceae bacterium]|nr:hypothetical protein [Oscillospiraceae bacterium]
MLKHDHNKIAASRAVPFSSLWERMQDWNFPVLILVLFALLCLVIGFTKSPRLYPVDFGEYEMILKQCSLTWTEEDLAKGDLQYVRPITSFRYTRFTWSNLLTPQAGGSLVYPVAVVRLFTAPFGLDFSVDFLAAVFAGILLLAVWLLSKACYTLIPRAWYVPGILLGLLFTDGNFCALFRALYPVSAAIAFSLLFCGISLYAFSLPTRSRRFLILPVWLASFLMLKSFTPLVVFLPAAVAVDVAVLLSCRKDSQHFVFALVLCVLLVFSFCRSAVILAGEDADYFSDASAYESLFNTMLPQVEDPSSALHRFELDESYEPDIGRSFYEDEAVYSHNPRAEEEASVLFAHLNAGRLVKEYLLHPSLLSKVIQNCTSKISDGFESGRNLSLSRNAKGFSPSRTDGGFLSLLWKLFPVSYSLFVFLSLLAAAVCIVLLIRTRKALWFCPALVFLCGNLYLPFNIILNGYAESQIYFRYQVLLTIALFTVFLCFLFSLVPVFAAWVTKYMSEPYALLAFTRSPGYSESWLTRCRETFYLWWKHFIGSRVRVLCFIAVLSAGFLVFTFLPRDHAGTVNNGDYGRMMAQLEITWPGYLYYDYARQAGQFVIEEYSYLEPFDPLKFTPLSPTYSLYWFTSLVRLLTEPFGLPFSTLLLGWLMGLISLVCMLKILWDLYPVLGKWTLAAALGLCALLFSETYLVWFNSLYGEGCILVGLVLTLMCAVHLCLMPTGKNWRKGVWLIGLALSLNILLTAKSQMLMAMPGAVLLFLLLSWHQRAYRYDFLILQSLLSLGLGVALIFSAVNVYQTDRTENSVSQKHTMWQAYFYGIFMISDDPVGDMEALGIDTAMAADIGKYVEFADDSQYVYAPLSEEADAAFYDHVSMFTILRWYLTHPAKLWRMMDHAAAEARELYTGFRIYNGQNYSDPNHDPVTGRNYWPGWRAYLVPGSFLGYVIFYGLLLFVLFRILLGKYSQKQKILCCIPLFLIVTGVLQFPLSVLGNGFADNQKQLFCFSLCHDFLLCICLVFGARFLFQHAGNRLDIFRRFPLFSGRHSRSGHVDHS